MLIFLIVYFSSSQFRDLTKVLPAKVNFNAPSYGHISTQRAHNIHLDSVTLPPFCSYIAVAWVGQTRLQTPHLVHFFSSFSRRVKAICLNGEKELKSAVKAPKGQMRHQNLLYANDKIVTIIKIVTLIDVK